MPQFDLGLLAEYQTPPPPFSPGEARFWDDEYISAQMLKWHLNPNNDVASRRPETIERMVAWMWDRLELMAGSALLDLGCGPGLYAAQFARRGTQVTGIDISQRSIEYARHTASQRGLEITYRCESYLTLEDQEKYDAAVLIYGDFCTFGPEQRRSLLANIKSAMKPGGRLALDVTTRAHRMRSKNANRWYLDQDGFWAPGLHLVLEEGFDYPEELVFLDQAVVLTESGEVKVYRNWFQDYTPETITAELQASGFQVLGTWGDLAGAEYLADSGWIGVVAKSKV